MKLIYRELIRRDFSLKKGARDPANRLADARDLVSMGFLTVKETEDSWEFKVTESGQMVNKAL